MKISVITAVYNAEETIAGAIASVAAQSHAVLEHLIIDGGSRDGTQAAVAAARHDCMHVISEPDDGIYDALNKGIARATGDVIGFLHSDDFFPSEDVLSQIATAFEDPQVVCVFGDLDYVSQSKSNRVVRHWATGPFAPERLKFGWMPAHPTLYLRRHEYERVGGYDTSFRIAADYDFILRYFGQITGRAVYIPHVLYKMRLGGVSNRNLSKVVQKMREDWRAIRRNDVGGPDTLAWKNLSKLGQFFG